MTHKEREVPAKVWELYFPDEVETERDLVAFGEDSGEQQEAPDNQMRLEAKRELRVQLYKTFLQFFEITCFNFDQSAKENGIIQIDVQLFSEKEKEAGVKWPEDFDSLSQALFRIPREVIGTCSIALHSVSFIISDSVRKLLTVCLVNG